MAALVPGIHHVTAIAGDPQRNLDFYAGVLGLRLVKLTVNFDDPGTYHFYYGDGLGRPGSILTFFPWPGMPRGRAGAGQVAVTSLAVPEGSLGYWIERLLRHNIPFKQPVRRFGESVLSFSDPDGLLLELVATRRPGLFEPWAEAPVPAEHAIRGLHGVALWADAADPTERLLTETLGFRRTGEGDGRVRHESGDGGASTIVDLQEVGGFWEGRLGVGTVHHVAWRTPSEASQSELRERIAGAGFVATPVIDRVYFRSVYFREPGGVLFEIATDPPGFAVDEASEHLGGRLVLPPWLEPSRAAIEGRLPELRLPEAAPGQARAEA